MTTINDTVDYIFGMHPVTEAVRAGRELENILVNKEVHHEQMRILKDLAKENNIPVKIVPIEKLNRITRKNHQGVIAFIAQITYSNIENIIPGLYESSKTPLILILDRVTDVRNFGAIARTAECAGAHAIVVPSKGGAPVNGDAMKTSAGALNNIPVCKVKSLKETIVFLKQSGVQVVACTEKTREKFYDLDLTSPTALILGSEEDGVSSDLIALCDHKAGIPMYSPIGSLNVSVACGIIMFELNRQRDLNPH